MTADQTLHVVLGATGGVGAAVVRELVRQGQAVRGVNRTASSTLPVGVEPFAADISQLDQARAACAGASVVYFCGNPAYTRWPQEFPGLLEGAIAGAQAADATLVVTDNLYVYGPPKGPINEEMPMRPPTRKGKVRAAMDERLFALSRAGQLRMVIGRASDFFGPGALNSAVAGEHLFGQLLAGKPVDWVGKLDVAHSFSYVEDFGRGLVTLGQHASALGQAWNIPAAPAITGQQFLDLIFAAAGRRNPVRPASGAMVRMLGLFNPLLREVAEMAYEFEAPFVMDGTKFTRAFGGAPTPLDEAVRATVDWFKTRMK